jgi:hypothetical protein
VAGSIDENERKDIVRFSCPGAGACGGMYTANTMAAAIEAMGMSLPYRWVDPRRSVKSAPHEKSVSWSLCLRILGERGEEIETRYVSGSTKYELRFPD